MILFTKLLAFKDFRNADSIKFYYKNSEDQLVSISNEEEFNDGLKYFISESKKYMNMN